MKDGDNLADYLARDPTSDESEPGEASATVSTAVWAAVSGVVSDDASDLEENDTQPPPPEDSDDGNTWRLPVTVFIDPPQVPRAKPNWWTEARDNLHGVKLSTLGNIEPVCPKEFKDETHMDVCAFDQPGFQTHTDSRTGETVLSGEGNELLAGVIGVIWSDHHVTMTHCTDKNVAPEMDFLRNFAQLLSLCPEGRTLTPQTHSKALIEEYDTMVQWKEFRRSRA
jgi:hypothetical protein